MDTDRRRSHSGYTLPELLVVISVIGIMCLASASAWAAVGKHGSDTAAGTVKSYVLLARLLAVRNGIHYFVVYDPATSVLSLSADTHAPLGVFDSGDALIEREALPRPADPVSALAVSRPADSVGPKSLSDAWPVLAPAEGAAASDAKLQGLSMTPSGGVQRWERDEDQHAL